MKIDKSYEKLLKIIGNNIQRIRKENGLPQEDMMDLGFNYRHYQKLESGRYSPNLKTLHRLAIVFKVSIDLFLK